MKKIIIYLLILIILTGCTKKEEINIPNAEEIDKKDEIIEEKYIDDNPITVGLYENDIKLVKEYNTKKEGLKDLVFDVYYTNEENLGSIYQKGNWYKYYQNYNNIDNYKIGFYFSFDTIDGKKEGTLITPENFMFYPYFYIYLYDDINQEDGAFYSHVEKDQVTENTIFSSIKLYLVEVDKVISPIYLTVFTYDSMDDFDEKNNYRGNSKYTITINLE